MGPIFCYARPLKPPCRLTGGVQVVHHRQIALVAVLFLFPGLKAFAEESRKVSFVKEGDSLRIAVGDKPFAVYSPGNERIPRPHFKLLHSPSGIQVTRNAPPIAGVDLDDHATFHPGLWMAFGDLSGADFWRNRAQVRRVRFLREPTGKEFVGSFAVLNSYQNGGKEICAEECDIAIHVRPEGYLMIWSSTFHSPDHDFTFGDQEEMGLGVRMATPLAVVKGGHIRNSDGLVNEAGAWGKQADWLEYSGQLDGRRVGAAIFPDPKNFRRSWFHARDYGLMVANPFGRNAFTKGEPSKVVVRKGEDFRLRFGVFFYDSPPDKAPDIGVVYGEFVDYIAK